MNIDSNKKFALLVGINYHGTSSALNGCINDVEVMHKYLIDKRGYKAENIVILTDDTHKKPTGMNIMHALGTLIVKAHVDKAEELWLHYSGHGSYTRDHDGDELDGYDETIVPIDYAKNGMITDDQLHDYVKNLPNSCGMIAIFDCCHSGTILDLKWRYEGDEKNYIENHKCKVSGNANVLMISGCQDSQTSADAYIQGNWAGAMTTSFLKSIDNIETCEDLLMAMRKYLKENRYTQHPLMCCSYEIKDDHKFPK